MEVSKICLFRTFPHVPALNQWWRKKNQIAREIFIDEVSIIQHEKNQEGIILLIIPKSPNIWAVLVVIWTLWMLIPVSNKFFWSSTLHFAVLGLSKDTLTMVKCWTVLSVTESHQKLLKIKSLSKQIICSRPVIKCKMIFFKIKCAEFWVLKSSFLNY